MTIRLTAIAAVSVLALGACATDQMGQPGAGGLAGMSRAQQGALAGAAAGAVFGAQRDDNSSGRLRDAARGAVVGAAAGAIAGSVLDQQAAALQQSVTNPNIQIVNRGSYLQVVMPEGVLFATGSAAVSGPAQNDLYAVARNLNQYPNSRVEVIGHTDSTGSQALNQDLSERRARSVAGILTAAGVNQNRVVSVGRAASQPVASNATVEGRAQNRRVEIIIRPTQ